MTLGLPTGTVTFLFTDIEGSTRIAQQHRAAWGEMQRRHHAFLRAAIEGNKGFVFKTVGDAFCAAFHQPGDAVRAALAAQRDLHAAAWGAAEIRVRMGIHTGLAEPEGDDYHGYLALSSVQRVMSAGHGGQVLLSQAAFDLVEADLPEGASLRDMGWHRLKDLFRPQRLYQLVVADLPSEFPALQSLDAHAHNLPIQLTSFVGREQELRDLIEALGRTRLLTLTGAGGTGKTRLALQAAAEILDRFKDGAWLVELASLSDTALVPPAIAKALNVREQPGRPFMGVLADHLRDKSMLLVLDNVEHLLDTCAEVADELLHRAPGLKILATGREALGIAGETAWPIRSLPVPAAGSPLSAISQSDSVKLFVERAVAVQPSFEVTERNAAAVAEICKRLDGIPLAIELAAARVKGVDVEEITRRLGDRFRLLTGGSRTALPRHRTLQATIDWSYYLLSDCERLLLRRLSAFAGGWTLAAAETVSAGDGIECSDILDLLSHLVDKSLVIIDQAARPARYRMLETIRAYGGDHVATDAERHNIQAAHCVYYLQLAERAYGERHTDGAAWLQRLEVEQDNMRAALEWAESEAPEQQLQLAGALGWFWEIRGHYSEGRQRLADALRGNGSKKPQAGRAWTAAGRMALIAGDNLEAGASLDVALALAREAGAALEVATALQSLSEYQLANGDYQAAQDFAEQALALCRASGDRRGATWALLDIEQAHMARGNLAAACAASEAAYPIACSLNDPWLMENAEHCMGDVTLAENDHPAAMSHYAAAVRVGRELGDIGQVMFDLEGLGMANAAAGRSERALRLAGASDALRESLTATGTWDWWEAAKRRWLGQARRELGEKASESALAAGRCMSFERACAYALEQEEAAS